LAKHSDNQGANGNGVPSVEKDSREIPAEASKGLTPSERARRRNKILLLLLLLLLLAGLGWALYYYLTQKESPIPRATIPQAKTIAPPKFLFLFDGSPQASMKRPTDVAIHPKTKWVYVTDTNNHRVSVFDLNGRFFFSFKKIDQGELRAPIYVDFNKKGDVYITDRGLEGMYVFTARGQYITKFIPNKDPNFKWLPIAFTFDEDDNLYVTDILKEHRVLIFAPDGTLKREFGSVGEVAKLTQDPGKFAFPNGITVQGNKIYVSDSNNRRIQVYNKQGKFLYFIKSGGLPRGIDIGYKDRLHLVDVMAHSCSVFTRGGKYLASFGEFGFDLGNFYFPNGISCYGRRIYVTDMANNRVQVWAWPVEIPIPIQPGLWMCPWALLLPLLLLLLWLLRKNRYPAHRDFLELIVENDRVKLLGDKLIKVHVIQRTFDEFKEIEQHTVKMEEIMEVFEYDEEKVREIQEEYQLDEESAALIYRVRRPFFKGRILAENEKLREVAQQKHRRVMDYEEFIEKYEERAIEAGEDETPEGDEGKSEKDDKPEE
jgi:DNA-binding beta-propeller fold protein YncE